MKFLKNYTSNVPVSQTIYRIEQVLIKCGVRGITKEYGSTEGEIKALTFHIPVAGRTVAIRLPADVDAAVQALWLDYVDGDKLTADGKALQWGSRKSKSRKDFVEQGEKTAWKIIQDWVEVQMSMIQLNQADAIQVFLPYVWDEISQQTFYAGIKDRGYKGLLPPPSTPKTEVTTDDPKALDV